MAANVIEESTHSHHQQQLEYIVNRWLVDYYIFRAIDAVKHEEYSAFCAIRDVLECLFCRPLECTDIMPSKIKVLHFLSRIIDGDKLEMTYESDHSITPLESAMEMLANLRSDGCCICQKDLENAFTSIKEMLVVLCLENSEFEKAKEILNKHFPQGMVGKKAIFMALANQKIKSHEVLEQITFKKFKEEMVQFCESIYPPSEPFLYKAAKQLVNKRRMNQEEPPSEAEPMEPIPSEASRENPVQLSLNSLIPNSSCTTNPIQTIQRARLEAAYVALSEGSDVKTFAELEKELEKQNTTRDIPGSRLQGDDARPRRDVVSGAGSSGPGEGSVANQEPVVGAASQGRTGGLSRSAAPHGKGRMYTVAQLVVEPDSHPNSQESMGSLEQEAMGSLEEEVDVVGTQEVGVLSAQLLAASSEEGPVKENTRANFPQKPHQQASNTPRKASRKLPTPSSEESESELLDPTDMPKIPIRKLRKRKPTTSSPIREQEVGVGTQEVGLQSSAQPLAASSEEGPVMENTRANFPQKPHQQASNTPRKLPTPSSEESESELLDPTDIPKVPIRKRKPTTSSPMNLTDEDEMYIEDSSLDTPSSNHTKNSARPQGSTLKMRSASIQKRKLLYKEDSKETKETWSDADSLFDIGEKGQRSIISGKKVWTEKETMMLKEAVARFGEGNWAKIRAKYPFENRTNVNLKDRWRTMKKLNMV